jgi:hypothetical protein
MPRPQASEDPGVEWANPPSIRSSRAVRPATSSDNDEAKVPGPPEMDPETEADLVQWERRLASEVDTDLFDDPRTFQTIHRVIDVLGLQLIDDAATVGSGASHGSVLARNPAYRDLQRQQKLVENAIEHMALTHCADLNGSVIRVGQVARKFTEAVASVKSLRRQVRDIQDTIGATTQTAENARASAKGSVSREAAANAMSLRELWLKKLECEAVLSLLNKLDIIRAAPSRFDHLVRPPCRIGAAVLCLSQALATMFSDDVAQVQALHKIMEQLMIRKQRAEELIWDILQSVLFLRTANGSENQVIESGANLPSSHGVENPFYSTKIRLSSDDIAQEADDNSVGSDDSGASLFSVEDFADDVSGAATGMTSKGSSVPRKKAVLLMDGVTKQRMMIPIPVIEAELDLEADERRCLEQSAAFYGVAPATNNTGDPRSNRLPRYADPVLSLRILVECLATLRRLDDVERVLSENLEIEIRAIVAREQARTFLRLERRRAGPNLRISRQKKANLTEFRRHWTGLLSAMGCVMLRISHLAQIVRYRVVRS